MNENDLNIFVCSIISNDLISVVQLKQFQEETQKDETLKMIIPHIKMTGQMNQERYQQTFVHIIDIVRSCVLSID